MCFRGFLLLEALILKHSHPIISWKTRTGSCIWCGDLPKIWWWPEYHSDRWLQDVITRNDFIKACVNDVYTYNRYYQVLSSYSCGKPLFSFVFLWPLGKPKHQRFFVACLSNPAADWDRSMGRRWKWRRIVFLRKFPGLLCFMYSEAWHVDWTTRQELKIGLNMT